MAVQVTRRMILLLVTALVAAAMVVATSTVAFAQPGGSENSCGASNPNIGVPAGPPPEKGEEFFDCGLRNNPLGGPPGLIKKF